MRKPRLPLRAARRGFMLIEVMVSVLIFTIGVLALVGLQASLTQAETAAKTRADAAFLANEIIGTMWSDMNNVSNYQTANCAGVTRCKEWLNKVAQSLPKGVGAIEIQNQTEVNVTLTWTPPDGSGDHTYRTYTNMIGAGN
ncbi:MAG: pilus assembly protein PilV [Aquabacterium sp.]|jgi:type IV pilus assembly protein PilV|nr:MAG: pilus assembly protein PilV [Aquabacterium sp.]TAL14421.1 MAG: pilus assembly protein PilV [Aquabacterium sp.]